MRKSGLREYFLDFKYDDEYRDDDEEPAKKKQRYLTKSRPSFMSSSYSAAVWANTDHSIEQQLTGEQLMDIAVSNFIRANMQDFKGLIKKKKKPEVVPQPNPVTLVEDWLDNQDVTRESVVLKVE